MYENSSVYAKNDLRHARGYIKATAFMNGGLPILPGRSDEKEVSQKVH